MVGKVNEIGKILGHPKDLTPKYRYEELLKKATERPKPKAKKAQTVDLTPPKNITPGKGGTFDTTV